MKKLANDVMFGIAKEYYKMLGKASWATAAFIGEDILEEFEKDLGLEITGEDPQSILTEIDRILVDEYGLASEMELKIDGNIIELDAINCFYHKCTEDLNKEGIPPVTCVPLAIVSAAVRKRLKLKGHFKELKQKGDRCQIFYEILE